MMWRLTIFMLLPQVLFFQVRGQGAITEEALKFLNARESVLIRTFESSSSLSPCNTLLLDCWLSKVDERRDFGNFGLRFKPVDDRNIYLLYHYELKAVNAKTELGFSVNYFNAFSIKYAQRFAIKGIN